MDMTLADILIMYLVGFVALLANMVLHEAGHYVAARLVGGTVDEVRVFGGRALIERQIGETLCSVGWTLTGGHNVVTFPGDVGRVRRLVVFAAGVAVNFAIAGVAALFASSAPLVAIPVVASSLLVGVVQCVPFSGSDGAGFLATLRERP